MAKIFISHSSEDKEIIDLFKNTILNAGLGILDNDIAYTSAPETGVPTGRDIPQYIKENIAVSDFVFFMISDNYRKSEVCLNEMGAAWALNKNVKPLLLYNVSFKSVGWLYGKNLCVKIDNTEQLDELRDEFLKHYDSCPKTVVWNRQKAEFLAKMELLAGGKTELIHVDTPIEESKQLGWLDYKETFDAHINLSTQILTILTDELNQLADKITRRSRQLSSLNSQSINAKQVRGIMNGFAHDMNQMSDMVDANVPKLLEYFDVAMENAIGMQQCIELEQEIKQEERGALQELISSLISAKETTIQAKESFLDMPDMEKSQIAAKKRLAKGFLTMTDVYDKCITKVTELLKA